MGLWHTNGSPNFGQKIRPYNNQQQQKKEKKRREFAKLWTLLSRLTTEYNCKDVKRGVCTSTLQGNWKKQLNMKVTMIPIVIGAFGTVSKGLLKGLEYLEVVGRVKIIQTTALLRTARILRRVLETWEDLTGACCHSGSSERPSTNVRVKNSQGVKKIIIGMIEWRRWSTGNWTRDWYFTILTNDTFIK